MSKRFEVIETFHDFQLVDNVTGRSVSMGDGCGIDIGNEDNPLEVGEHAFRQAWEDTVNDDILIYMEIYFPDLYALQIQFDESGNFADPYTVVLTPSQGNLYHCLNLSKNCDLPQGVGYFDECLPGPHLGTRVDFAGLPQNMQRYIAKRLED